MGHNKYLLTTVMVMEVLMLKVSFQQSPLFNSLITSSVDHCLFYWTDVRISKQIILDDNQDGFFLESEILIFLEGVLREHKSVPSEHLFSIVDRSAKGAGSFPV